MNSAARQEQALSKYKRSGPRCHQIPVVVLIPGCYERQMVPLWRSDPVPTC